MDSSTFNRSSNIGGQINPSPINIISSLGNAQLSNATPLNTASLSVSNQHVNLSAQNNNFGLHQNSAAMIQPPPIQPPPIQPPPLMGTNQMNNLSSKNPIDVDEYMFLFSINFKQ